jgi:2-iminobutanoate/2-iminopropanoate deaminase
MTDDARAQDPTPPVGPYSPARWAGPWLICSGQLGTRMADGRAELAEGFAAQSRLALENAGRLLAAHGLDWSNVVKVTVFLTDPQQFASFNEIYADVLGEQRPARSAVMVAGLPLGALVEVEVWAYSDPGAQGAHAPGPNR